jgi:hypothetical protein
VAVPLKSFRIRLASTWRAVLRKFDVGLHSAEIQQIRSDKKKSAEATADVSQWSGAPQRE